jgi:hypothetical protein
MLEVRGFEDPDFMPMIGMVGRKSLLWWRIFFILGEKSYSVKLGLTRKSDRYTMFCADRDR